MIHWISGTSSITPIALPAVAIPSARPRIRTNQLATAVVTARLSAPMSIARAAPYATRNVSSVLTPATTVSVTAMPDPAECQGQSGAVGVDEPPDERRQQRADDRADGQRARPAPTGSSPRSADIGAMNTEKPAPPVRVAVNIANVATPTTTQP